MIIVQELLILPLGTVRISPLLVIGTIFTFGANAGYYYGLDGKIQEMNIGGLPGRILDLITDMPLPARSTWPYLAGGMGVLALYHVLAIGTMEAARMELAAMEFAGLLGVSAIGVALAYKGADAVRLSADLLRLFVGYRVLHEIFVRTDPGINGLPGWAPAAELTPLFEEIAANQVAPIAWFIEVAMLPFMGVWAAIFAVLTTVLAVGLLMGWRTKAVSAMGLVYTGFLISLGFTRYAPFVFGYLFVILALGGKYMSIDSTTDRSTEPLVVAYRPSVAGYYLVPVAVVVALVSMAVAFWFGNTPGEYMTNLQGTTATMVFIFAVLLSWTGFVQHGGRRRLSLDLQALGSKET